MRGDARRQRKPESDTLIAQLDALCRERGVLTRGGRPNYTRLALLCGFNKGVLVAWRRQDQWPSWATLEQIARFAGQEVGPWLRAGGFDEAEQMG